MAHIPITVVRFDEAQARQILGSYIFGGPYGRPRPPRGIAPELVAEFLRAELKPDSPPRACERALEVMRFYELQALTPHLRTLLAGTEQVYNDVRRSAFLLQALGDLGTLEEARWGSEYFDRTLVRKAVFVEVADLLLDTLLALAPAGSPAAFSERLRAEIAKAKGSQGSRKLREMEDNRLPGFAYLSEGKKRLLDAPPDRRRWELISIYLGQSDLSEPYMVTWAARMIRRDAMEGDPTPIYSDFGRIIETMAPARGSDSEADLVIVRAAQAIVYLQGKLTPAWRKLYDSSHPSAAQNFLWDDSEI